MGPEHSYAPEKFHLAALRPLSSCVSWTSLRVALTHAVSIPVLAKDQRVVTKSF